jgi:hypothetical protein
VQRLRGAVDLIVMPAVGNRIALFNAGTSKTRWPVQLFRIDLGLKP